MVHLAGKALAQFNAKPKAEVAVNLIIARAIVKVNPPGMGRALGMVEAVVVDGGCLVGIEQRGVVFLAIGVAIVADFCAALANGIIPWHRPKAVAPPRIKRSMVGGFALRIKDIVIGNLVPAKAAIVHVNV